MDLVEVVPCGGLPLSSPFVTAICLLCLLSIPVAAGLEILDQQNSIVRTLVKKCDSWPAPFKKLKEARAAGRPGRVLEKKTLSGGWTTIVVIWVLGSVFAYQTASIVYSVTPNIVDVPGAVTSLPTYMTIQADFLPGFAANWAVLNNTRLIPCTPFTPGRTCAAVELNVSYITPAALPTSWRLALFANNTGAQTFQNVLMKVSTFYYNQYSPATQRAFSSASMCWQVQQPTRYLSFALSGNAIRRCVTDDDTPLDVLCSLTDAGGVALLTSSLQFNNQSVGLTSDMALDISVQVPAERQLLLTNESWPTLMVAIVIAFFTLFASLSQTQPFVAGVLHQLEKKVASFIRLQKEGQAQEGGEPMLSPRSTATNRSFGSRRSGSNTNTARSFKEDPTSARECVRAFVVAFFFPFVGTFIVRGLSDSLLIFAWTGIATAMSTFLAGVALTLYGLLTNRSGFASGGLVMQGIAGALVDVLFVSNVGTDGLAFWQWAEDRIHSWWRRKGADDKYHMFALEIMQRVPHVLYFLLYGAWSIIFIALGKMPLGVLAAQLTSCTAIGIRRQWRGTDNSGSDSEKMCGHAGYLIFVVVVSAAAFTGFLYVDYNTLAAPCGILLSLVVLTQHLILTGIVTLCVGIACMVFYALRVYSLTVVYFPTLQPFTYVPYVAILAISCLWIVMGVFWLIEAIGKVCLEHQRRLSEAPPAEVEPVPNPPTPPVVPNPFVEIPPREHRADNDNRHADSDDHKDHDTQPPSAAQSDDDGAGTAPQQDGSMMKGLSAQAIAVTSRDDISTASLPQVTVETLH
eukprot:TRINITY_DN7501_c0_g1_i1.p1 TRINITY_DN7501_c0_g1~~TRINITY_DN7501_c0_g1_i1.p1  ORF type:complete len:822 (+),score=136.06 TRINITY_DN7501_c0_g1_i1:67-2466(+)